MVDEVAEDEEWYAAREASERREAAKAWGDDDHFTCTTCTHTTLMGNRRWYRGEAICGWCLADYLERERRWRT